MKVITEAILRSELRASTPECYKVPEGKILSPAAREYLQQCKIRIDDGKGRPGSQKTGRHFQGRVRRGTADQSGCDGSSAYA